MKAAPTLDGRIRIDLESRLDWLALGSIVEDARSSTLPLSFNLGEDLDDPEVAADWKEFVSPELDERFDRQLETVRRALEPLDPGSPATLFIPGEEVELWYGALNQARLALEEEYALSFLKTRDLDQETLVIRFRADFYQTLQSLLLDFLMRG